MELAKLVAQAYDQAAAFQRNREWNIRGGYSLVRELRYMESEAPTPKEGVSHFAKELRRLARTRAQLNSGLPIGFIAQRGAEAVLVFRGTMTANEWIADFKVRLTPNTIAGTGKVHDGFLRTYTLFREAIRQSLESIDGRTRLFVAGHSLGAGLATLAAMDLASRPGSRRPALYTFASPRVGDRQFARDFNGLLSERSFRIANTCDLVTSIPFPVPFLRFIGGYFTHVETPVEFTIQHEDVEKNHSIDTYLKALEPATEKKGLLRSIFGH